ncbi:unnamed protein product [Phytophthora lilii]|uniref:Unnamed protein product n=1 Tax=Phytophthora lilii TaxID=2077276 RepID=A0A9W6X072_9STRA|nr:unnamed protein product [Phytophthora lilii]
MYEFLFVIFAPFSTQRIVALPIARFLAGILAAGPEPLAGSISPYCIACSLMNKLELLQTIHSFSAIAKLFPGTAANKAAKVAKQAAAIAKKEKVDLYFTLYFKTMLQDQKFRFDEFRIWRSKRFSPAKVDDILYQAGKTGKEYDEIVKSYRWYLGVTP